MATLSTNSTIAALERLNYEYQECPHDRDIRRITMFSATSGITLVVSEMPSEPNFLDITYGRTLACDSDHAELELRRALDVEAQNDPFIKTQLDVTRKEAAIKVSSNHQLANDATDRRLLTDLYVHVLLAAPSQLPQGRLREETEAA